MTTDILLAVWNRFHSAEQLIGFSRHGLSVHWVGNTRPPSLARRRSLLLISALLLKAYWRVPGNHGERLLNLSRFTFDLSSQRFSKCARLAWCYLEYNNRLLRKCKLLTIPTILDVPIGHMRQFHEVKEREFHSLGLPYVVDNRETWTRRYEEAYALADHLVVGSNFVKTTLQSSGIPSSKIIVNPYGVDTSHWAKAFTTAKYGAGKLIFVFTGRVDLRKGVHHLLSAWKSIDTADAELWICGHNYLPTPYGRDAWPANIKFLGPQTHASLVSIFQKAHVYVFPSLFEGLARSGLEALASGLPCIVTRESGLTDFVVDGENGWIVPSGDLKALADSLRVCMGSCDRLPKMAKAAFDTGQQLDWSKYGDRCSEIARRLLDQPPR
jgi:glycosyltransferase involved in cell wall biosynthesis